MERKTIHLIYFAGNGVCLFFALLLAIGVDMNGDVWIFPYPWGERLEVVVLISGLAFCVAYMRKVKIDLVAMFSMLLYLMVAVTFVRG